MAEKWEKMVEAGKATRFTKGQIPWSKLNKGKYSTSRKGIKLPEWWKTKLSEAKKGKPIPHLHKPEIRKKIGDSQRGEKSHNWMGGRTPLQDSIRNSAEYKAWRKSVFEKDKYTCTECGDSRGKNLQADHIEALSFLLHKHNVTDVQAALICAELWDITNGRTLCISCHRKTDNYGGRQTAKNLEIYG